MIKIRKYLTNIWESSFNNKLSFLQKIVFLHLIFLEKIYIAFFKLSFFYKNCFCKKKFFDFKIISIGNISVGGTGKSVLSEFLINNLKNLNGAIILRGYKSLNEKTKNSFLVSDGQNIFCSNKFCGDEAFMLANNTKSPVIIGSNRIKSCDLLKKLNIKIDYVILDDAYQNLTVKKDLEILLLDSRRPFENNHCLPAGRLREKDISRANIIILTHSNLINSQNLIEIKKNINNISPKAKIYFGVHSFSHFSSINNNKVDINFFKNKKFLVFAGIGNFDSFVQSIKNLDIEVFDKVEYPDHYEYSFEDLDYLLNLISTKDLAGAIITKKDWSKLYFLIKDNKKYSNIPVYVSNIEFKFLKEKEQEDFFNLIKKLF